MSEVDETATPPDEQAPDQDDRTNPDRQVDETDQTEETEEEDTE